MPKITELYAWVVEDTGPDDEGVPAFLGPGGGWLPMMGADLERATSLRGEALRVSALVGKPVRLVRSIELEEVEVVQAWQT